MLLQGPPLVQGWNGYLGGVRTELTVSPKLRELAICGVALLDHADYEYHDHAPEFLREGGSARQLDGLRDLTKTDTDPAVFDAPERAVRALAIHLTRNVEVSHATMASLRAALHEDRRFVEIVAVIATYNMVSRFLVALGVEVE